MKISSQVCHLSHFIIILSNHDYTKNLKFLKKNVYRPSIIFLFRKSLFKNAFDKNFSICQPIFKLFAAQFVTNLMLNCAKNIFHLYSNM